MSFVIEDLRRLDDEAARCLLNTIVNSPDHRVVILIGHGNTDGSRFHGVGSNALEINQSIEILWLYGCNTIRFASEIAGNGLTTLGFTCTIFSPTNSLPHSATIAHEYLRENADIGPTEFFDEIRRKLLEVAKQECRNTNLFNAAVINHTRLALRKYS